MVRAYKFTRPGGRGPITGFAWPRPSRWRAGAWVESTLTLPCVGGIHACRAAHLPYWLAAELWEIELDGEVVEAGEKLVAPRGRLVRPIRQWTKGGSAAFARDCALRVRDLAADALAGGRDRARATALAACSDVHDLQTLATEVAGRADGRAALLAAFVADAAAAAAGGDPAGAAHVAAVAAGERVGPGQGHDPDSPGYRAERARQAAWLVERLNLRPG